MSGNSTAMVLVPPAPLVEEPKPEQVAMVLRRVAELIRDPRTGPGIRRALGLDDERDAPVLLTVAETAALLRTSRKAIYAMIERRQLAGVRRLGRRVLVHREELLDSLAERRAASPGGRRR